MVYEPDWETIEDAVGRITAHGMPEVQAQRDLCRAIADHKIDVRQHLAANRLLNLRAITLLRAELAIPARLSPADVDWAKSRSKETWAYAQQRPGEPTTLYAQRSLHLMDRTVELTEVRRRDVTMLFLQAEEQAKTEPSISPEEPPSRSRAVQRVHQAIEGLWSGILPANLSNKDRERQINEWLTANRLSQVSLRTIQRAVKEHRC